jgi:hypothetical protein
MSFSIDSKLKLWILVILAVIIPGSGYVFTGKATRGLLMLMWMFVFAFITFRLTDDSITYIGRLSGGLAVWTLSVVEVYRIGKRRLEM